MIYQWISNLMDEAQRTGVLVAPPPLLTRAFNAMENGLQDYHKALKLADTPFPFPYTAGMEVLLTAHFILTPVITAVWTDSVFLMVLFTFFSVWSVWMLHLVAGELENPFGLDETDLDMETLQRDNNAILRFLYSSSCQHVPYISERVKFDDLQHRSMHVSSSFLQLKAAEVVSSPRNFETQMGCDAEA